MKFEIVPISSIDFHDKRFFIGSDLDNLSSIKISIREVGIINPPVLKNEDDKFIPICGWRRISALKDLGLEKVLAKVYDSDEITNEGCLQLVLFENRERLNDIEKAELVFKFKNLCALDDNDLIKRILPPLGIAPTWKNLERYLSIAELEPEIKNAFHQQKITLDHAVLLSELRDPQRLQILERIILRFKLNKNETREAIQEIQEVAFRDRKSIGDVIESIENRIGRDGNKNEFRHELKLLRYPVLTQVEENFKECLKDLNLPKDLNIFHPPFFEGNYVEIRIRIESAGRLSEILSYFESVIEKGLIDKLMSVVKEGIQKDYPP